MDDGVFALLERVAEFGSLQSAARSVGVSYRHAWGLLAEWERRLGRSLVTMERGRGTRLAALGEALVAARRATLSAVQPELARLAGAVAAELNVPNAAVPRLTVHASHDLALLRIRDSLAERRELEMQLKVQGSLASLEALLRRRCDLAGFHTTPDEPLAALLDQALPRNRREAVFAIQLFTREQGLMMRRDPNSPYRSLQALVQTRARFINRQRGSGTRQLFDRLLHRAGLAESDVRGYGDEEFTHLAVAATVAGGGADVGFGIRAAAVQFGLAFVPLAVETYYLAYRGSDARDEGITRLARFVGSEAFRSLCAGLPGYDARESGHASRIGPSSGRAVPRSRRARR